MAAKRVAMAARSASRGGIEQDGGEAPGRRRAALAPARRRGRCRCRATPPRRGRCAGCRWGSVWPRWRVLGGEPGMQGRGAESASSARASARACGPGSGMSARPCGQRRRNTGRCRRSGSAGGPGVVRSLHGGQSLVAPPGALPGSRRGADAVERVGHAGFLLRRRAGGEDAQFAIHLHGVGVDDGAAEALGQIARASADLPLAVGPATSRACGRVMRRRSGASGFAGGFEKPVCAPGRGRRGSSHRRLASLAMRPASRARGQRTGARGPGRGFERRSGRFWCMGFWRGFFVGQPAGWFGARGCTGAYGSGAPRRIPRDARRNVGLTGCNRDRPFWCMGFCCKQYLGAWIVGGGSQRFWCMGSCRRFP